VQIGGPAGAFIVIVYGIVERYGVANLLISTACAGVLLFAAGLFGLGRLVRFVPLSIVVGFTNGIAVLILLSQLKDLLGLTVAKMPADVFSQLHAMALQIGTFNPYAFGLGIACVAGLLLWPLLLSSDSKVGIAVLRVAGRMARTRAVQVGARMPGPIVALVTLTLVSWGFELPVETIGTRFGGIPEGVPAFALPDFSWETVKQLVTPTLTIALLGAIESLLCARVSDQLSGQPRHDPNQELMAQGIANIVTPFFGGMPATGTIARTVTNIRSGGTSPIAGIVHAITLLAVVLLAAPLARHVPLAVLAGILVFVGLNMGEWREFTPTQLRHFSRHYRCPLHPAHERAVQRRAGHAAAAGAHLPALRRAVLRRGGKARRGGERGRASTARHDGGAGCHAPHLPRRHRCRCAAATAPGGAGARRVVAHRIAAAAAARGAGAFGLCRGIDDGPARRVARRVAAREATALRCSGRAKSRCASRAGRRSAWR
jgi:xanthine/uracil/vitamin C permease (AzgA family)